MPLVGYYVKGLVNWSLLQTLQSHLKLLSCIIISSREINHLLDFITRPVGVFTKNDALSLSGGRKGHKCVTGGRLHFFNLLISN